MKAKIIEALKMAVAIAGFSALGIVALTIYAKHESVSNHLRNRAEGLANLSSRSANDKLVADEYKTCWERGRGENRACALQAVDLARTQGRDEGDILEAMGVLGIFEDGCKDSNSPRTYAIRKNPELQTLMNAWCAKNPETKTEAEAPVL